ncbi:PAAR domain-containing protein [Vibrio maritimus]|uniref:PAAR domain-containing protein n=1 Tax=Vibrio maritimus TaxID=990268 RepID=UPI001F352A7B|nr:PAAR domain-containing protein [Vibrio maritimus]
MAQGALVGDMGSGHADYPATVIISGSPTVKIDGKSVVRQGDAISCGGVIVGGSSVNIGE